MRKFRMFLLALHAAGLAVYAGKVWKPIAVRTPESATAIFARNDSLWVGVAGGVRLGIAGGTEWKEPGSGFGIESITAIASVSDRLIASEYRYLLASDDGGRTWAPCDSTDLGGFKRIEVRNDTLFAWYSLFSGTQPDGIRFSPDGGHTWGEMPAYAGINPEPILFGSDTLELIGGKLCRRRGEMRDTLFSDYAGIRSVAVGGSRIFALAGKRIFVSGDSGRSWSQLRTADGAAEIRNLTADSDNVAVLTTIGLSLSRNRGADWTFVGPAPASTDSLRIDLSSDYLWYSKPPASTLFRYSLALGRWDTVTVPLARPGPYPVIFTAARNRTVFADGNHAAIHILLSEDQGEHFVLVDSIRTNMAFQSAIAFFDAGIAFVKGIPFSNGFFHADNAGKNWKSPDACTPAMGFLPETLSAFGTGFALLDRNFVFHTYGPDEHCPAGIPDFPGTTYVNSSDYSLDVRAAGTGNRYYLAQGNHLWSLEDTTVVPIRNGVSTRQVRRNDAPSPGSVLTWPNPFRSGENAGRIDAKGAVRRQ